MARIVLEETLSKEQGTKNKGRIKQGKSNMPISSTAKGKKMVIVSPLKKTKNVTNLSKTQQAPQSSSIARKDIEEEMEGFRTLRGDF